MLTGGGGSGVTATAVLNNGSVSQINFTAGGGTGYSSAPTVTIAGSVISNPVVTYASPNSAGQLTFTPVAGRYHPTTITVVVQDNGGTAVGGIDTIFKTIAVSNANTSNPPSIAQPANLAIPSNAGLQTVPLTGISDGNSGTEGISSINATSSNTALITNPVVTFTNPTTTNPITTGMLTFTPIANRSVRPRSPSSSRTAAARRTPLRSRWRSAPTTPPRSPPILNPANNGASETTATASLNGSGGVGSITIGNSSLPGYSTSLPIMPPVTIAPPTLAIATARRARRAAAR